MYHGCCRIEPCLLTNWRWCYCACPWVRRHCPPVPQVPKVSIIPRANCSWYRSVATGSGVIFRSICQNILTACVGGTSCNNCDLLSFLYLPSESCEYLYIEQPPTELACNPYFNMELRLECTVEVPLESSESIVTWFHSVSPTPPPSPCSMNQLSTNLTESIFVLTMPNSIRNGRRFVRTQLRIRGLTDSRVGSYWCMVQDPGQNRLLPSDLLFLQPAAVYANLLPCPTTQAVSKEENKCAVLLQQPLVDGSAIQLLPTISGSSSEVYHLQSTSFVDSISPTVTGLRQSTISIQTSKVITSSGQETTSSPQPSVTYASPAFTVPPLGEVPGTNNDRDKNLLLKLYIAIGVLGVTTVLILVLLIVSVGLYLRKHHQKRELKLLGATYHVNPKLTISIGITTKYLRQALNALYKGNYLQTQITNSSAFNYKAHSVHPR